MNVVVVEKCAICQRPTNLFNYGVNSCNACKMFFRRVIFGSYPEECKENGKCSKKTKVTSKCRYCRFQICVQAGMMYTPCTTDVRRLDSINVLLNNLTYLDNQRRQRLVNFFFEGDPTIDEMAAMGHVRYIPKTGNMSMTLDDWGFMTAVTTIDYMKKSNITNLLDLEDRKVFMRSTYFTCSIFASAMRAYQSKQANMTFPDGSDVIPGDKYPISRSLENRIRCRLVGRLDELKVTNQEFLLLSVIFFCNPAIPGLTEKGRCLLTCYQRMYSSTLLQLCLISHQQSGPSRFGDLLSLCHVINWTFEDMSQHYILFMLHEPKAQYRKLFG